MENIADWGREPAEEIVLMQCNRRTMSLVPLKTSQGIAIPKAQGIRLTIYQRPRKRCHLTMECIDGKDGGLRPIVILLPEASLALHRNTEENDAPPKRCRVKRIEFHEFPTARVEMTDTITVG